MSDQKPHPAPATFCRDVTDWLCRDGSEPVPLPAADGAAGPRYHLHWHFGHDRRAAPTSVLVRLSAATLRDPCPPAGGGGDEVTVFVGRCECGACFHAAADECG